MNNTRSIYSIVLLVTFSLTSALHSFLEHKTEISFKDIFTSRMERVATKKNFRKLITSLVLLVGTKEAYKMLRCYVTPADFFKIECPPLPQSGTTLSTQNLINPRTNQQIVIKKIRIQDNMIAQLNARNLYKDGFNYYQEGEKIGIIFGIIAVLIYWYHEELYAWFKETERSWKNSSKKIITEHRAILPPEIPNIPSNNTKK